MLTITTNIYRAVAEKLLLQIADNDYFNGTIEYEHEDIFTSFKATLIIYKVNSGGPDIKRNIINNIVPVWWEFNTEYLHGQVLNDFSWSEFKQYLL